MRKDNTCNSKPHHISTDTIYKALGIMLVLTLLSTWLVSGMLAKYTTSSNNSVGARVAGMANVELHEHKAELQNGVYILDANEVVDSNVYDTVLPGVDIPKDAYIQLDGKNEVSCSLYIELVNTELPDEVNYTVGTSFEPETVMSPSHGGTLYKYKQIIQPNSSQTITHIFSDNKLVVSDELKDKTQMSKNTSPFGIEIYAYLVQID